MHQKGVQRVIVILIDLEALRVLFRVFEGVLDAIDLVSQAMDEPALMQGLGVAGVEMPPVE